MSNDELQLEIEIELKTLKDVIATFQLSHEFWNSYSPDQWIFRGHALEEWELNPEIRQFNPNKRAEEFKKFPSIELHPIMALAQHYKLPTRLLDFTFDPLAALFFAAEPPVCGLDNNNFFVVYALNRFNIEKNVSRYKEVHAPSFANENLRNQKGLFILDKSAHESLTTGQFPAPMDTILHTEFENKLNRDKDMIEFNNHHYFYRKIKISENLRKDVLIFLHKCYYNRAHLFPSYENVAETVRILPHLGPPGYRIRAGSYH